MGRQAERLSDFVGRHLKPGRSPNPLQNKGRYKMKSTKEKRITVRLTPEQYESIREKADTAMMSPSAYMRAAAMRHKVVVVPGLDKLTHELKGIGRNLNQLLILAHEGRIQRVDLSGVTAALEKIYGALIELMTMESR